MARILLDDPSHAGGSTQLLDGTVANDGTGDTPRNGAEKLKAWAADINTMTDEIYDALPSGTAFSNVGAPDATNTFEYAPITIDGVQTNNGQFSPIFRSVTDTNNSQINTSGNVNSLEWNHVNLNAGFQGNRDLTTNTLAVNGAVPSTDTSTHAYVTTQLFIRNNGFNVGGTALNFADAAGQFWGADFNLIINSGSTNLQSVTGLEIDNNIKSGSSLVSHYGIALNCSTAAAVRGSLNDAGIVFGASNTATTTWRHAMAWGALNANNAFGADSTYLIALARTNPTYVAPIADCALDVRATTFTSGPTKFANAGTDATGNTYAANLITGGSLTAESGAIASVATSAFGGVTGGAYFAIATFPAIVIPAPPNSGTQAAATVATMGLTQAIMTAPGTGGTDGDTQTLTGLTGTAPTVTLHVGSFTGSIAQTIVAGSFVGSISGTTLTVIGSVTGTPIAAGNAITGSGISANTTIASGSGTTWTLSANQGTVASEAMTTLSVIGVLTVGSVTGTALAPLQFLTGSGVATGTYIMSGSGTSWIVSAPQTVASTSMNATSATIATAGSLTVVASSPGTSGGSASVQPTYLFGFGILTVTVGTPGTGYNRYPLPLIHTTSASSTRNIPASLIPTMTMTTSVALTPPAALVSGWGTPTGNAAQSNFAGGSATLAQTSAAVAQIIATLKALGLYSA